MNLVPALAALAAGASTPPFNAIPTAHPAPSEIVNIDYAYGRAAWSLTCLGYDNAHAANRFERLFGKRMRRIDAWATDAYGETQLAQSREEAFPDGFVMVGGCRVNSETGEARDPVPDFAAQLRRMERRAGLKDGAR